MRILLTGGTGLIGTEIGKKLVARGDSVVFLVRDPDSAMRRLTYPARCYAWAHDRDVPAEALRDVDAVINLAGEPLADQRWTEKKKRLIYESRVLGTRALIEAVHKHGENVKVFVQGSAIGFYGDRGDEILNAESTQGRGFLSGVVHDWELEAMKVAEGSRPIRLVIVRTSVVLARQGGALAKMLPVFRAYAGGRLGVSGAQWMSWIHIDDIAKLFIYALNHADIEGVLEGAAPHPVQNKDFTRALCHALGVIQNVPVPGFILKALLGEMASAVLGSERVVPTKTLAAGFEFSFETLDAALGDLV